MHLNSNDNMGDVSTRVGRKENKKYVPFDFDNGSDGHTNGLDVSMSMRNCEAMTPHSEDPPSVATVLKTLFFILVWYTSSLFLTMYNKSLLGEDLGRFPVPLLMDTVHCTLRAVLSRAITWFWCNRFQPSVAMSWRDYFARVTISGGSGSISTLLMYFTKPVKIVPTALGTAMDVNLSNASLVFISVTFATMCKSASTIFLLLFAFAFRLESPSIKLSGIILVISVGILLTVAKETEIEFWGSILVMLAAVMSGFGWSMTQILLQKEANEEDKGGDLREERGRRGTMSLEPDVVSDILSRLPIKSLVRFQGVSKSWCSLIKDPYFIRKHFNQSTSSDRNGGILIKYCCPTARKYAISFLFHDSFSPLSRYEVPPQIDIRHLKVVGSCNGLLCVANDSNVNSALPIYLWNPALREFRLLPNSLFGIAKLQGERISGVAHGFGYHPDADDYKLVRMVYLYRSDRPCFQAEVYSLSTDSWREISATNYLIKETSCVVYNDRLHWIAYEGGVKNREMIVSFNMGDEMFQESVLPDFHSAEIRVCMRLAVFKHSLCLINYYGGRAKSFDLWVMNNDGTGLFWTRQLSVGPLFGVERPLGCARNGDVFLEKRCGWMIVYNPRTEEIVNLPILGLMYTCELHLHQESLVSVYGRNGTLYK